VTYEVEVDMALGPEGLREVRRATGRRGISARVVDPHGPGGGNPVVKLRGSRSALVGYLTEVYGDEDGVFAGSIERVVPEAQ